VQKKFRDQKFKVSSKKKKKLQYKFSIQGHPKKTVWK